MLGSLQAAAEFTLDLIGASHGIVGKKTDDILHMGVSMAMGVNIWLISGEYLVNIW